MEILRKQCFSTKFPRQEIRINYCILCSDYKILVIFWQVDFLQQNHSLSLILLRKKCPYLEFFRSVFSRTWVGYKDLLCKSPYSIQIQENADHKNSECGNILLGDWSGILSCVTWINQTYLTTSIRKERQQEVFTSSIMAWSIIRDLFKTQSNI